MLKSNILRRLSILTIGIILPFIFLYKGIYGSFLFTFSIPLIWQILRQSKETYPLGSCYSSSWKLIIIGGLTGCLMGIGGGLTLKWLGINGQSFSDLHPLQIAIGPWSVQLSLQNELGYRLLKASHTLTGLWLYFIFSVFIIGLGEELFWRKFIQQKFNRLFSTRITIFITNLLFALTHCYLFTILSFKDGITLLLLIAVAGGVWSYLLIYFKNIWPSVISHGVSAFILWKYFFFN